MNTGRTEIKSLSEDEAIQRIVETVQQSEPGTAPFALVVGSGFSHGLVPTARELVEVSLPLWIESLKGKRTFDELKDLSDGEVNSIAGAFWERFRELNAKQNLELSISPNTRLPEDYAAAYRTAFNPSYMGAVGEPGRARKFQRVLMRLDQTRLNAAHFLLASLLECNLGDPARTIFSRLTLPFLVSF